MNLKSQSGILFLFLFSFIMLIIFISLYFSIKHRKEKDIIQKQKDIQFVDEKSRLLHLLDNLNHTIHYHQIQLFYQEIKHCSNKNEYDRTSISDLFSSYCINSYCHFYQQFNLIKQNKAIWREYENQCSNLLLTTESFTSLDLPADKREYYRGIETELFYKRKLKSPTSLFIRIEIGKDYNSPQGRSHYYDSRIYSLNDFFTFYHRAARQQEIKYKYQESMAHERALMTPSLRYKILKRDSFRCTICGASAQEGAKLHVDHIIPIAKDGKTVESNLRTLCERCNLGKRDRYDPNGLN